ncbi:hypothetical protein ACWEFL_16695 [Streptomyces sp. NPDC004838]
MPPYTIRSGDRNAFITGLRELADYLTTHPGVLVPRNPSFAVLVQAADTAAREEGANWIAIPLGVPVDDIGEGYYTACRDFGPIAYRVYATPPGARQ